MSSDSPAGQDPEPSAPEQYAADDQQANAPAGEYQAPTTGEVNGSDDQVFQAIPDPEAPEPREHVGDLYWGLFATSIVLWLCVQVGLMFALPANVPVHSSGRTMADAWVGRQLAFVGLWVPVVIPAVLPLVSWLVLRRPLSYLVRSRWFWLGSMENRRRFERLMREDLIVVSVFYMVVLAWMSFAIGLAAKDENGAMPAPVFIIPMVLLVLGIIALLIRGYAGSRYDPRSHFDLDAPE